MPIMKRLFTNIARLFVVSYARRILRRRISLADKLHKEKKTRYYVAYDLDMSKDLIVINRKGFRGLKRLYKIYDPSISTLNLKDGAYYYTADAAEKDALHPIEQESRKIAFINLMLERAGLVSASHSRR